MNRYHRSSEARILDLNGICAAPFLICSEISKRAQLIYRVFRKLSYVNLPGFLWRCCAIRIPAFSFSKRALIFQYPFLSRSPFSGRTAFFVFYEQYPASEKGRRRKWRLELKNSNKGSCKPNRTRPEYRSHTGPPAQTEKPVCTATPLCEGCPFPGHGFLCQGVDG